MQRAHTEILKLKIKLRVLEKRPLPYFLFLIKNKFSSLQILSFTATEAPYLFCGVSFELKNVACLLKRL